MTSLTRRPVFLLILLLALSSFWIVLRPPMIDLPQHAAQIAGLRDMIRGTYRWHEISELRLMTPYLLGYGPAALLSLVMPVEAALALIYSLTFMGFVWGCCTLRKTLQGDETLDPLFVPAFFGFLWYFGFYSFLVVVPFALFAIHNAILYARHPTIKAGCNLVLLLLAIFFSHALVCVYACLMGGLLVLWHQRKLFAWQRLICLMGPFLSIIPPLLFFILINADMNSGAESFDGRWSTERFTAFFSVLSGSLLVDKSPRFLDYVGLLAVCLAFLLPLVTSRLSYKEKPEATLLFVATLFLWFALPARMMQIDFVFTRYSVFLLPFYLLLYSPNEKQPLALRRMIPALLALIFMTQHIYLLTAFAHENKNFSRILEKMEPNQRVLSIPFNDVSAEINHKFIYWYYGVWYQAEKGGWVDFNFAYYRPHFIRFREGMVPDIGSTFMWIPFFDAARFNLPNYRYILLRVPANETQEASNARLANPLCPLTPLVSEGPWRLYERGACAK